MIIRIPKFDINMRLTFVDEVRNERVTLRPFVHFGLPLKDKREELDLSEASFLADLQPRYYGRAAYEGGQKEKGCLYYPGAEIFNLFEKDRTLIESIVLRGIPTIGFLGTLSTVERSAGPQGQVGIPFFDRRDGTWQASVLYFEDPEAIPIQIICFDA